MSFKNEYGANISYECDDLIEELKADIAEFGGDTIVAVWCKKTHGVTIYTNYDFIEEPGISASELNDGEYLTKMTMSALLVLFEKQNEIL